MGGGGCPEEGWDGGLEVVEVLGVRLLVQLVGVVVLRGFWIGRRVLGLWVGCLVLCGSGPVEKLVSD